ARVPSSKQTESYISAMIESRSITLLRGLAIGLLVRLECGFESPLPNLNQCLSVERLRLEDGLIVRLLRIDRLSHHGADQAEIPRRRWKLEEGQRAPLCGQTELDRQPKLVADDQVAVVVVIRDDLRAVRVVVVDDQHAVVVVGGDNRIFV